MTIRYRGGRPTGRRSPSVEVVEPTRRRRRACASSSDVDLAAMVAAARRTADLVSFAYEPPTLSELFRQAVAA